MVELREIEKKRSELLFIALLLIAAFSASVIFLAVLQGSGSLIPSLGILSLLFCLYVIQKERRLKSERTALLDAMIQKERDLRIEQEKAGSLGEKLHDVAALYRAISAVDAVRVPDKIYLAILQAALGLVDGPHGSVMLLDREKEVLKIVAAVGLSDEVIRNSNQPLGKGVSGWVVQHGEPVLLSGKVRDERFKDILARDIEIPSSMCVPLQAMGETIGVLNLNMGPEERARSFTEQNLRLVTIFSRHATMAIENARLKNALHVKSS